jgi:hypothetical protein
MIAAVSVLALRHGTLALRNGPAPVIATGPGPGQ